MTVTTIDVQLFSYSLTFKDEGTTYKYPAGPDLSLTRVAFTPAFTYTSLDYAGPVFVKNIYDSQNMYKAWVFIFTCASPRVKRKFVPHTSEGKYFWSYKYSGL